MDIIAVSNSLVARPPDSAKTRHVASLTIKARSSSESGLRISQICKNGQSEIQSH